MILKLIFNKGCKWLFSIYKCDHYFYYPKILLGTSIKKNEPFLNKHIYGFVQNLKKENIAK